MTDKPQNNAAKLAVAILLFLVAAGIGYWRFSSAIGFQRASQSDGETSGSASGSSRYGPEWDRMHPEPVGADLLIMPVVNYSEHATGFNFENNNFSPLLVQTLMAAAGKPVSCPEPWNITAAIGNRAIGGFKIEDFEKYGLAKFAAELKIPTVVYVSLDGGPTSGTVAHAFAVDSKTSSVIGRWTSSLATQRPSFDSLMDVQVQLSQAIAAGLCGMKSPEELMAGIRQSNPEKLEQARSVVENLQPFTIPLSTSHTLSTMRTALSVIEDCPALAEGWAAYAEACHLLNWELGLLDAPESSESTLRGLVAGEIAALVAPENRRAQRARVLSLAALGRTSDAMRTLEEKVNAAPGDPLLQTWLTAYRRRPDKVPATPPPATLTDPADQALWNYLPVYATLRRGNAAEETAMVSEWVEQLPNSADQWARLGGLQNAASEIGYARFSHAAAAITGSLQGILECVLQLEEAGKAAEASQLSAETGKLIGNEPPCADGPSTSISQCLSRQIADWTSSSLAQAAYSSMFWESDSPVRDFATALASAQSRTATLLPEPRHSRPRGVGIQLRREQWRTLASAAATYGMSQGFQNITERLGADLQTGNEMLQFFHERFPDDIQIQYQLGTHIGNQTASNNNVHFQKVEAINFLYGPHRLRNPAFWHGPVDQQKRHLLELKLESAFDASVQRYVAKQYEVIKEYQLASELYRDISRRFPPNYEDEIHGIYNQAVAENRVTTAPELDAIETQIEPDHPDRDRWLFTAHYNAGDLQKCTVLADAVLSANPPSEENFYYQAAFVKRMLDDPDGAIRALEQYVRLDPSSLKTLHVFLEIANIEEARNDLAAARKAVERARKVDNWQGDGILHHSWLVWKEGKTTEALNERQRNVDRYSGDSSHAELAKAQMATGLMAEARATLADGRRVASAVGLDCVNLEAQLLVREGKPREAVQLLTSYVNQASFRPEPHVMLSQLQERLGNYPGAVESAQRAETVASPDQRGQTDRQSVTVLIKAGMIDEAEAIVRNSRARRPWSWVPGALEGELLLHKGDPAAAIVALEPSVRFASAKSEYLQGLAYFQTGDHPKALQRVTSAMGRVWLPEPEWFVMAGDIHAAQSNTPEAIAQWTIGRDLAGPETPVGKEAADRLAKAPASK